MFTARDNRRRTELGPLSRILFTQVVCLGHVCVLFCLCARGSVCLRMQMRCVSKWMLVCL